MLYEANQRHNGPLHKDPTLIGFNFLIIHLDVDIAQKDYSQFGQTVEGWAMENAWKSLPCNKICPPISDTVNALVEVLESWLGQVKLDNRTVLCLPAQSSGTWLAAAVLPATDNLLTNAECHSAVESGLEQLPKLQRIKKTTREYRANAPKITAQWMQVKHICSQAERFEDSVSAVMESK